MSKSPQDKHQNGDEPRLRSALADAELLLAHAAENGLLSRTQNGCAVLPQSIVDGILDARAAVNTNAVTPEIRCNFWLALADLSQVTRPVTAASLIASQRVHLRLLKSFVMALATMVILGSIWLFMNNSTAAEVMELINDQNAGALKLWSDLQFYKAQEPSSAVPGASSNSQADKTGGISGKRAYTGAVQPMSAGIARLTPDELFGEIVEFSRRSNWLLETASRLNHYFNFPLSIDTKPVRFEKGNVDHVDHLRVPPGISTTSEIVAEGLNQIVAYQLIRNFAQAAYRSNSVFYGGLTTYLLPAVYALLGAALYALRTYSRLLHNRSYLPSAAHSTRYFIALIAGVAIGAFSSMVPKGVALPPFAVAFLVGYGVEVFFSRLDDLIDRFKICASARSAEPKAAAATASERD